MQIRLFASRNKLLKKMQTEINRLKCLTEEKNKEIEHLAMESKKLEDALANSKNSGANLLIEQIINDIVESGLVKFEVKE